MLTVVLAVKYNHTTTMKFFPTRPLLRIFSFIFGIQDYCFAEFSVICVCNSSTSMLPFHLHHLQSGQDCVLSVNLEKNIFSHPLLSQDPVFALPYCSQFSSGPLFTLMITLNCNYRASVPVLVLDPYTLVSRTGSKPREPMQYGQNEELYDSQDSFHRLDKKQVYTNGLDAGNLFALTFYYASGLLYLSESASFKPLPDKHNHLLENTTSHIKCWLCKLSIDFLQCKALEK